MSQGSYPCIHYKKSHNAWAPTANRTGQEAKKPYKFFPDAYFEPCEAVTFSNGVTLYEADHIFSEVRFPNASAYSVSERTLLKENRFAEEYKDLRSWSQYKKDDT